MRFRSTAKVLAKCMIKYYRISECDPGLQRHALSSLSQLKELGAAQALALLCRRDCRLSQVLEPLVEHILILITGACLADPQQLAACSSTSLPLEMRLTQACNDTRCCLCLAQALALLCRHDCRLSLVLEPLVEHLLILITKLRLTPPQQLAACSL